MSPIATDVDGQPAVINEAAPLVENTIENLVHDLRRHVAERNKRAVAASRARERVKESNELIEGIIAEICRLDEKASGDHLRLIADSEDFENVRPEDDEDD